MARIRPKYVLEYVVLCVAGGVMKYLPYRAALFLAWLHAWPAHFIFRFRRKEAKRRIRLVFGDTISEERVNRIAWISWRNTLFNAVDMMRMSKLSKEWVERHFECAESIRMLRGHQETGKGGIIAVPHMGAWDLSAVVGSAHGIPIFGVAARQRNPLANKYIDNLRRGAGLEALERGDGTMKQVIRRLRQGSFFAILPDVRMRTPGIEMPFLGGTANLGKGMALFARQVGVPIFPSIVTRQGWSHHSARPHPAICPDPSLDKEADIERMTRAVICMVDNAIRREPEQWFWYNKRWVLDPLD